MDKTTSNYVQTKFDKLILQAVEYLLERKKEYEIKSQKELLDKLQIHTTVFPQIKNKQRGFALDKIESIMQVLNKEYQISYDFMRYGIKPITLVKDDRKNLLTEEQAQYNKLGGRIDELEKENAQLRAQLADKITIIDAQALAIKNFKALYEGKN